MASKQKEQKDMLGEVETITPRMAEEWLKTMVKNRIPSDAVVYDYGTQMQEGRWIVNGETIKFDSEGHMFDGQHRCLACMISGKPFKSYVVRGIKDERSFSTVDVGKLRNHSDIFSMSGFSDYSSASTSALFLYYYEHNLLTLRGPKTVSRTEKGGMSQQLRELLGKQDKARRRTDVSKEELIKFAMPIREKIIESLSLLKQKKTRKLIPVTLLAPCHYLFAQKNKFEADQFVEQVIGGVGLMSNNPIYCLRERLIANQGMRAKTGHTLNRWTQAALVIKAWNKVRAGEKITRLNIYESEDFPRVK